MMRFSVLGSGSRGNCLYVESGTTRLLIDGGFSGRQIAARLAQIDRGIEALSAICITHEHQDHVSGVGVLSRRCRIPLFANEGTFRGADRLVRKPFKRREFETGGVIEIGSLQIRSFAISHDTSDPVGFVVSDGRCSLGLCTDTGIASRLIARRLAGCNALILEFNHDPDMLKSGPYPEPLKQRVRSTHGHLANGDGARLLADLLHDGLHRVVLAHLSETNNLPALALRAAAAVLKHSPQPIACDLSSQNSPTALFSID